MWSDCLRGEEILKIISFFFELHKFENLDLGAYSKLLIMSLPDNFGTKIKQNATQDWRRRMSAEIMLLSL